METKAKTKKLPAVLPITYEATKDGWAEFAAQAQAAHRLEYELKAIVKFGKSSFGVVWVRGTAVPINRAEGKAYASFYDEEDAEFLLSDDMVELLDR